MSIIYAGYQSNGTPHTYTTREAAIIAANALDLVLVEYENANQNMFWFGALSVTKNITIAGALSHCRIQFDNAGTLLTTGDHDVTFKNLTIKSTGSAFYNNRTGRTYNIQNCKILGSLTTVADSTFNIKNNLISTPSSALSATYGTWNIDNNTFSHCRRGIYQASPGTAVANNNIFYSCNTEIIGTVTGSNNAGQDGTAPATGYVDINSVDPKFVRDNLDDDYPDDFRIITGSDLQTAGIDVGLTEDIDGISYSGGFPIGCSFGLLYPNYLLNTVTGGLFDEAARSTDPVESNVLLGVDYKILGVDKSGTFAASSPTAPTLTLTDNKDGTGFACVVSGSDTGSTNQLYVTVDNQTAWTAYESAITGDGTIDVSIGVGEYWVKVITQGAGGSFYDVSSVRHVSVTNGSQYVDTIRNAMADVSLYTIKLLMNKQCTLSIPGFSDIVVYCSPSDMNSVVSLMGGATDTHDLTIHIPRQTGFPPTGIKRFPTGIKINLDDDDYQVVNASGDFGSIKNSSVFRFDLSRHGATADY